MPALRFSSIKPEHQRTLLEVARYAIEQHLNLRKQWQPALSDYPLALKTEAATFVTLYLDGKLRGCIGTLRAYQPIVQDVAQHAFQAAFSDNRFEPLSASELTQIKIDISILSDLQQLPEHCSQADLLSQLTPKEDGLILTQDKRKALFLPQVWKQLPKPEEFLMRLKMKGGWHPDAPVKTMRCYKFQVMEFGENEPSSHSGEKHSE